MPLHMSAELARKLGLTGAVLACDVNTRTHVIVAPPGHIAVIDLETSESFVWPVDPKALLPEE